MAGRMVWFYESRSLASLKMDQAGYPGWNDSFFLLPHGDTLETFFFFFFVFYKPWLDLHICLFVFTLKIVQTIFGKCRT